jgi:hypothetical protein
MSRSVDLFIQSTKPIEEFVSALGRAAGVVPTPGALPGTWSVEKGGVHAELRAHPYVDGPDLVLERYQYALSARVGDGSRPADSAEANFLRVVGEALRKSGMASLLVHDLQYRDRVKVGVAAPAGTVEAEEAAPAPPEEAS